MRLMIRPTLTGRTLIAALFLTLGLALAATLPVATPSHAQSAGADDEEALKEEWQGRYRQQLQDAARLRRNASAARRNYTQAQKRNYPRGGAREVFLDDEREAQADLVRVEQQIEDTIREGRLAGALPGWFAEVDDEPIMASEPATPAGMGTADSREDREGRNPLYFDSDEE
jgi:hypothetical protein